MKKSNLKKHKKMHIMLTQNAYKHEIACVYEKKSGHQGRLKKALANAYICVLILLYMCPYTTICVVMLLYMCPHTAIYVSLYYYMCRHTTIYVSSYYYICVLILLNMCPHTTIYVSSYY